MDKQIQHINLFTYQKQHLYIYHNIINQRTQDMKPEQSHFEAARKDFQVLKKNKEIPPQMEIKLQYLLLRIQKKTLKNFPIESLPEYQKNSLDQLNIQTGTHLFCNIVNCLSGKDVVLYFRDQKAYIRKDQLFSMWSQCWITCDSNNIILRKKIGQKPSQVFEITNLRISKNYRLYKRKHVFGVCYNKKKNYLIGFDLQSVCARVHQLLRGVVRQKVLKLRNKNEQTITQISLTQSKQLLSEQQQPKSRVDTQNYQQQQVVEDSKLDEGDQTTDRGFVIQFIKQQQLNGDSLYKLHKTQDNLRQMINKNYPNKFKTQIILSKPKHATNIFDYYIKMNQWNPQIQQSNIKIKLSQNSYLLHVKVKKYSYLSWPRQTVLLATALIYSNKYFLVLRSTGEDCTYSDTVKMQWNQIVEVCESQDKALISIATQMDFKGYCSLDDSQRMGLKANDALKLFTKYYEAKQINSKSPKLFNLSIEDKKTKKIIKKQISSPTKAQSPQSLSKKPKTRKLSNGSCSQFYVPDDDSKQQPSQSNYGIQKSTKTQTTANKFGDETDNFSIYLLKNPQSEVSTKLIQLIKKNAHERYYLRHKFDQTPYIDIKRFQHQVQGPNNYITQNGNWKVNQQEDIVFVNQKVMELQKDIIKMVIKQISSNIMSGKSIMNMSLPVQVFDSSSILQRVAMGLGYAPKFLLPASETTDLVQQAKNVALFVMGIGPLHITMSKPFNPILGQTFQCKIGGIPAYFQQISHHPPISAVLIKTDKFTFSGAFHSHAEMGLNRVTGKNLTPLFIEFPKTNTFYQIKLPEMQIGGLIHGDKKYRGLGKCFIHERTNNLFMQWSIGKDKKKVYQAQGKIRPNDLYGGIYTVTPGFSKKFRQCENKQKFDGLKPDDIIQTHVKITGHWCFNVFFNNTKVKSIQNPLPNKIQYPQYILPSDSNFRLDLLYKRLQDYKTSNQQKQIMQNIQRRDRKLRQGKIKATN